MSLAVNVEEKLFQNRYKVDAGRPHIKIKDANVAWEYPRGGHGILFKFG